MLKKRLNKSVLQAAQERIAYCFDRFEKIYVSFSGGKDSTVMTHLVLEEAIKRGRKVGVLFIDWECQFTMTIDHIRKVMKLYKDHIQPFWISLPILTNNACSMFEPLWKSWDKDKKDLWVRSKEPGSISHEMLLPFYYDGMTFEEFVPLFGKWFSEGMDTCCFVGIRTQESLNRFRTLFREKPMYEGNRFSTNVVDNVWNFYPIYDWQTEDIWSYFGKTGKLYNKLYDRMHQAGLSIHQMRIDEPFGDEARKGLWLYQVIEPQMWAKFVARMSGINSGALYCSERGNVLGNQKISLPPGHTWQSFTNLLLNSMPPKTGEHYKNKIAVYLKWYRDRGYENGIPDQGDWKLEQMGKIPAWRQIAKTLLRNDYWCRNLGFGVTKSKAYTKYLDLMRKRRNAWKIYETS